MARRYRIGGPAPNAAVCLLMLAGAGFCGYRMLRFDRDGRSASTVVVPAGRNRKGGAMCDYAYVVDGIAYVNHDNCVGRTQVDYLPYAPAQSRLQVLRSYSLLAVGGYGVFAILAFVLAVVAFLNDPRFWCW